jgi:hypothetical protein
LPGRRARPASQGTASARRTELPKNRSVKDVLASAAAAGADYAVSDAVVDGIDIVD